MGQRLGLSFRDPGGRRSGGVNRGSQAKILLVEDDADLREIAVLALATGGFQVRDFGTGEEAISGAAEFGPDLLLVDVMMPGLDGPATIAALRERVGITAPAVYFTARAMASEQARYRALGAVDVIAKPFDPMKLPGLLREILRAHGTPR